MNKNKMGFTLVELLAVVVILTVIIIIAIPVIDEVVENSRKATFEASARNIAVAAEKKKMENNILSIIENTDTISCSDVVNINDVDYSSCGISFDGNTAKVSLIGSGKFEDLQIIDGTKDNASAEPSYITNYIKILYSDENARANNGLKKDNTKDANIRYYGANPNNYIKFSDSDEVWRIIGVFGGSVKLVKSSSIGNKQWTAGVSGVNNGAGINQWGASTYTTNEEYPGADLQVYLNNTYYNSLSEVTKSAIDKHLWSTGGVEYGLRTDTDKFYNVERGTQTGKICTSGGNCNDTVNRTTEWEGYVALAYPTDWGYASATSGCDTNMQQQTDSVYTCKNDNWMHYGSDTWFLSPYAHSSDAFHVWSVYGGGLVNDCNAHNYYAVFPAVYLKNDVKIVDGKGTSEKPYILSVN